MKTLPLTVLFHEGPMGRAYLEMLFRCGLRPQKIIHMLPKPGALSRLMPRGMRASMLKRRQDENENRWPRVLHKSYPGLYEDMTSKIESAFDLGEGFIDTLRNGVDLSKYGSSIETVELAGFKDPTFISLLEMQPQSLILFTGGGILPAAVFEPPQIRFLHFHPGALPHVRGADGLLWSTLIRGRPGVSGFIMQPGLDVGDLITVVEPEPLTFGAPGDELPDNQSLYRMIFSFYDPVLRAVALRKVLSLLERPGQLVGTAQDPATGVTYHFMGRRMRYAALGHLFPALLDG